MKKNYISKLSFLFSIIITATFLLSSLPYIDVTAADNSPDSNNLKFEKTYTDSLSAKEKGEISMDSKKDGIFTIAVIPDTQQEVVIKEAIETKRFKNRIQWLVDNKEDLDLRFIVHTGDVVNWDTPNHDQFEIASEAMQVADDAGIPNLLALGNHDTAAVGPGGSAADPSRTTILVRDTTTFNTYFSVDRHPGIVTFEEGKVDNSYITFEAEGLNWMVMVLELWPRSNAIKWAKSVIDDHPEHNVLIATHSYLDGSGNIYKGSDYGANSPKYLFDMLVKVCPNIKFVFSGHVGRAAYRIDTGNAGNKIVSILGAFHSNDYDPVQLLEIDVKENTAKTKFMTPMNGTEWTEFAWKFDELDFIVPVDVRPELTALVNSEHLYNEEAYTTESWNQLNAEFSAAKAVLSADEISNKHLKSTLTALSDALIKLEPKVKFNDVSYNNWYFPAINYLSSKNLVNGTGEDNFSPESLLKRADYLVMLMRAYEIQIDESIIDTFSDAGDTYYTPYLNTAKKLGITQGTGENKFKPEREITREEMFVFLYNILEHINKLPTEKTKFDLSDFSDSSQLNDWSKQSISFLVKAGIIQGDDGKISPTQYATRAQAAQVLYNLLALE